MEKKQLSKYQVYWSVIWLQAHRDDGTSHPRPMSKYLRRIMTKEGYSEIGHGYMVKHCRSLNDADRCNDFFVNRLIAPLPTRHICYLFHAVFISDAQFGRWHSDIDIETVMTSYQKERAYIW